MKPPRSFAGAFSIALASASIATAEDNSAQQLSNLLAAIISAPFQINFDYSLGATGDGTGTTLNFQPVVPFSLYNGANLITRMIIPYVWQEDVVPGTSQEGFGDISLSAWYSRTTEGGLTWGVGPTMLFPTGSTVSGDTLGLGVTGIALQVSGPWT